MADVARVAGVSLKTVSRVVNHEPHTRAEVVARVNQAIAELGWVPHGGARAMRTGRTGRIAVGVADLRLQTVAMLVEELVSEADRRGLAVSVEPTHGDAARAQRVIASAGSLYDGVLMVGDAGSRELSSGTAAVITVQAIAPDGVLDHVRSDVRAAAAVLVRHLGNMHRGSLVLIGAAAEAEEISLLSEARRALGNTPFGVVLVPSRDRAAGAAAAETLLRDHPDADAILCETDEIALGLLSALAGGGIDIPGRFAITGFGGTDDAQYTMPSLTTVDPGYAGLARAALDALEARLAGGPPRLIPPSPVELVRRESTLGRGVG